MREDPNNKRALTNRLPRPLIKFQRNLNPQPPRRRVAPGSRWQALGVRLRNPTSNSAMNPLSCCLVSALLVLVVGEAAETPQAPVLLGFARIPAGEFMMGDALDGIKDASPHKVILNEYFMQDTEVYKAQWDDVQAWGVRHGYTDLRVGDGKAADHPVRTVTWYDVVKWCNARSEKEGLTPCYYTDVEQTMEYRISEQNLANTMVKWLANGYRLPTEAEWEQAARGGLSGKRFPWGDTISHYQANFYNEGKEAYQAGSDGYKIGEDPYTSPVGSFAANGYGIHNMAGNVWEWCWDWYAEYPSGMQTNPRGHDPGSDRVVRGGSWASHSSHCRVAHRYHIIPSGLADAGFHPVRSSVH